ncbi:MAG TPA: DUF4010 domain-containing protein [Bryobacteraceae bacterium]|nr:DUF4010 domain-containing protein [Bryobacteraceae bacterium]
MNRFLPLDIGAKLLVALGIGLLVGFEREWSHKDLGVRTFAITSLLGMLAALIGPAFEVGALVGVIALFAIVNLDNLLSKRQLEMTTAAALLATFALGVLVGEGHVFTPTAAAILMTLLLAMKPEFSRFAGVLTESEVRSAVLLGLIGFVIYPVLPNRFVDPWNLFNPREAWLIVILLASIGFANYVLLRLYGARSLYYTAAFGGLMNSTVAIAELSGTIGSSGQDSGQVAMVVSLLTVIAMFARNLILLAIFSPPAAALAVGPIVVTMLALIAFAWKKWRAPGTSAELKIRSPISVRQVAAIGAVFILIEVACSLGQRLLGQSGTLAISTLGGFVSSASATAAVAALSASGSVRYSTAALATVLSSTASAFVNLPIVYRQARNGRAVRFLAFATVLSTLLGIAALVALTYTGIFPK